MKIRIVVERCTALDMAVRMNIRLACSNKIKGWRCGGSGLTSSHVMERRNCHLICCLCRQGTPNLSMEYMRYLIC